MNNEMSEALDLKLIRMVKDNVMLYDGNHPQYADFNAREVVWQKIGDELQRTANECKSRWVNIRDINRRNLKNSLRNPSYKGKRYKYYSELAFMTQYYRDALIQNMEFADDKNKSAEDDDEVDQPYSDDEPEDEKPIKKVKPVKLKKTLKKKKRRTEEDAFSSSLKDGSCSPNFDSSDVVDAFLLSIGASLKKFSPYHLNLAKTKIFSVVQDHELQQIVSKEPSSSVKDVDADETD